MMEWKEELQQHTKEAEKVVQGYLLCLFCMLL